MILPLEIKTKKNGLYYQIAGRIIQDYLNQGSTDQNQSVLGPSDPVQSTDLWRSVDPWFEPQTIFDKNFVLVDIEVWNDVIESGILLMVNLATRKLFWIEKIPLEDKIRDRAANLIADNGQRYILEPQ